MSYFTCSECTCTFEYSDRSPPEHKPVVIEGLATNYTTTKHKMCVQCWTVRVKAVAVPPPKPVIDLIKITKRTFIMCGGRMCDFDTWKGCFSSLAHMCEYLQREQSRQWAAAYQAETGQEWKP